MMDDREPFIYKTTDFGKTWTNITGDLPATHPLDYVMAVAENPNRKGMLFAGTGHAFYYSMDDGAHWTMFNEGLPHGGRVVDRRAEEVARRRRLDVRPRRVTSCATSRRSRRPQRRSSPRGRGERAALSAASGLSSGAQRPSGDHVRDRQARRSARRASRFSIRRTRSCARCSAPTRAGYNRVTWDLRYDPPRVVAAADAGA